MAPHTGEGNRHSPAEPWERSWGMDTARPPPPWVRGVGGTIPKEPTGRKLAEAHLGEGGG